MVLKSRAPRLSGSGSWSIAEFSQFYTQNRFQLVAHANRILRDRTKADEVTQEALVKFMLAAPELSSSEHALNYLHRTIENLCMDMFRAENRRPNLVALDEASAEVESVWQVSGDHSLAISAAEDAAIIRQALALLSPAERAALVMWEVDGRSKSEIAKELGINESAVRHTISRARASLRRVLSELIVDENRGLTALDLLSSSYKKTIEITSKSSKIALTFVLVLTAFLGLNSLTGREGSRSEILTPSTQLFKIQDTPNMPGTKSMFESEIADDFNSRISEPNENSKNSISVDEYSDHMTLASTQLETLSIMLQVLELTNGDEA